MYIYEVNIIAWRQFGGFPPPSKKKKIKSTISFGNIAFSIQHSTLSFWVAVYIKAMVRAYVSLSLDKT